MPNPYMNQFMPSGFEGQEQGLTPVFQNIGAQQALQNQNIAQQNQLNQQASQIGASYGQGMGGLSPLAMASALRGKPGLGQTTNAFGKVVADPTYGAGTAYGNMSGSEIANMLQNGL